MSYKKGKKSRGGNRPTIPEFFSGKSVFITGGTGFMGKVLIEKLLRSCPDLKTIYLLLRPKKEKSLEERIREMTSLPIFVKIKRQDETALQKIIPLKGDVSERMLGLSDEDQKLLEEVSIFFHVAASVRFDDELKKAILMNTRGTYEAVKLAQKMKKLEVFLHVSTTYCNTHKDIIEEIVYPAPDDWRGIIKVAENMDAKTLEIFCGKILGLYPNTYTFTKGLAEHVVLDHSQTLPAIIFRPSIVISSILEPMPGWVDNFNGPVGLLVASGKGIIRSVYSDPNIRPDYIPVDLAVKAMITSVWNRATSEEHFSTLPVYNCSSHEIKRVTQRELVNLGTYVSKEIPLNDILWIPGGGVTKCKFLHYFRVLLFHLLPALVIDFVLKFMNKKPMLMKIQRKIFVANLALEYFLTRQWSFRNDKLFSLNEKIPEEDMQQFSYYIENVDEVEYMRNCAFGARQYLLKEDNTDLPEARKHQERMYWLDKTVKIIFLLLIAFLAVRFHFIQTISGYVRSVHGFLPAF